MDIAPGENASLDDVFLILRGWEEDKRRVRVIVRDSLYYFAVWGVIKGTEDLTLTVGLSEDSFVRASLLDCRCAFADVATDNEVLGECVECGIVGARPGFNFTVMLMAEA